jgi:hypothetical protein
MVVLGPQAHLFQVPAPQTIPGLEQMSAVLLLAVGSKEDSRLVLGTRAHLFQVPAPQTIPGLEHWSKADSRLVLG